MCFSLHKFSLAFNLQSSLVFSYKLELSSLYLSYRILVCEIVLFVAKKLIIGYFVLCILSGWRLRPRANLQVHVLVFLRERVRDLWVHKVLREFVGVTTPSDLADQL